MNITKLDIKQYFNFLKSRANDPLEWISKKKLTKEKFYFLEEVFDELWVIKQNLSSDLYKKESIQKHKPFFESEKTYIFFLEKIDKAIQEDIIYKKTKTEKILLFLNNINFYWFFLILVLIILLIVNFLS